MTENKGYHLLYTDGNRNGTGGAMIGGLIKFQRGKRWLELPDGSFSAKVETDDIDEFEYMALIAGLQLARQHELVYLRAYMDRESVVEQVNGRWQTAPHLEKLRDEALALVHDLNFRLAWIPREFNAEADALARPTA